MGMIAQIAEMLKQGEQTKMAEQAEKDHHQEVMEDRKMLHEERMAAIKAMEMDSKIGGDDKKPGGETPVRKPGGDVEVTIHIPSSSSGGMRVA